MSDLDDAPEDIMEQHLALALAAHRAGTVKGMMIISYMQSNDVSMLIAGQFDTYTNTLGVLEYARDALKLQRAKEVQEAQQQAVQKKPLNWGPGGNA